MQSFVDRFRAQASKARQAQSRVKALARMPQLESVIDDTPTKFAFPEPAHLSPPILSLDRVTVGYDKTPVLRDLSLRVDMDDRIALLGANGAGKTTLLNAIMGIHPARGSIRFQGQDLARLDIEARVQRGMVLVPERRELFSTLSVHDNLLLGGFVHRKRGAAATGLAIDAIYDAFPRLRERRAQHAGTLSGGERQMLAIGRALMAKPRLLMLDEPSLGLAPLIVREIFRIIAALRERGVSILLVEQNARAALQVADYAYVLETGAISMHGPAAELAQDPRVVEAYLGLAGKHQDRLAR